MKQFITLTIFSVLFLLLAHSAQATETIFEDDFSHGLNKWQAVRGDGSYWEIKNGALEAYIPTRSTLTELVPTDENWGNVTDFDFNFDMTPLQGVDRNVSFGFADTNNWYELHFTAGNTILSKVVAGQVTWSYDANQLILENNQTYHLRIYFKQGKVTLVNDGQVIFSEQDPEFNGQYGKIGLKASAGATAPSRVRFDNILVKEVVDLSAPIPQLDVSLIKQTDPRWSAEEYDTANNWIGSFPGHQPTINDWGCNLASLLMIMKYHGINQLPDGTELTPLSLNDWLKDNNGFINSPNTGLINRKITTQLTKLITDKYQTPSLEFRLVDHDLIETVMSEIDNGRPVILELEGHFVVATGYTANHDLIINDPAYDYTLLSQHSLQLKSVRTFTPSFTDLSYLEVISDPEISINIINQEGEEVQGITQYIESLRPISLQSAVSGIGIPQAQITELAKPTSATYFIRAANSNPETKSITVRSYAEDGQIEVESTIDLNANSMVGWEIMVNANQEDQIEMTDQLSSITTPTPTPDNSVDSQSSDLNEISVEPVSPQQPITISFNDIRLIVSSLENSDAAIHPIIAKLLLKLIDLAERWYNSPAKNILVRIVIRVINFMPNSILAEQNKKELLLLIEVFNNPQITVESNP